MVQEFQKQYWEGVHQQGGSKFPIVANPSDFPDEHRLFTKYLDARGGSLFEVGCAPGRWLAYFAKQFAMQVSGIDYAAEALELTRANMAFQGIEADLAVADFFSDDLPASRHDVVYSRGFIEHFPETQSVVNRLVGIVRAGGHVVTTVPNFVGLNGWLRSKTAPASYAGHVPIDARRLRELHENAGVETLFCDYCGVPILILRRDTPNGGVSEGGTLWRLACVLVNATTRRLCRRLRWVPRARLLSPTVVYIGRRRQ